MGAFATRTRPRSRSTSGVTADPASKTSPRVSRLTTAYSTRKGLVNPRLGTRRCSGIWPPSKPRLVRKPDRDLAPFVPRAAVLPWPEPIPRPTRFLGCFAPFGGRNLFNDIGSISSLQSSRRFPPSTVTRWRTFRIRPRVAGVSTTSTVCRIRRRPSPRSVSACLRSNPIALRTCVIRSRFAVFFSAALVAIASPPSRSARRRRAGDFLDVLAAQPGHVRRVLELHQRVESRPNHVVMVGRSERLRQHVVNAGRLDDRPHRAAGDDAGAVGRRLQEHRASPEVAEHGMGNRRAPHRHPHQGLLRRLNRLLDRRRHFLRLADAEADHAAAVPDHDERAEAQILAALDDLRDTADVDDRVLQLELSGVDSLTHMRHIIPRGPAPRRPGRPSELQPRFAGRVGDRSHATVIEISAPIEDDARNALLLQPLRDDLPDRLGAGEIAAAHLARKRRLLQRRLRAARRGQRRPGVVVDHLCVDVQHRAEHHQPRPFGRARDPLALAESNPIAAILFGSNLHHYAPVLPTFFFRTSPMYRTPFCLYGSGFRRRRMSAATWPTSCRSMPVTVTWVCLSITTSMPVGMSNTTGCEYPSAKTTCLPRTSAR